LAQHAYDPVEQGRFMCVERDHSLRLAQTDEWEDFTMKSG
jgi:hypothetical protein